MTTVTATYLGIVIGFVSIGFLTLWYVRPFVNRQSYSQALTILIAPHIFRYIALQLFAAQATGLVISDSGRKFIAYGDVAAAILALVALWAVYRKVSWTKTAVWIFAIFGFIDLTVAVGRSMTENLSETADPVLFLVSTVYVPILYMSLFLLFGQHLSKRNKLPNNPEIV